MENITLEELGKILKQRRKEKGITQKDVAERLQVEQSLVSSWERGLRSPSFLNIYKLCQLFDITLDEMLGLGKPQYITLTLNRNDVKKFHSTLQEYEEALNFIFPGQDTTLHHKWTEVKRLFELLLLNMEQINGINLKEGYSKRLEIITPMEVSADES